MVKLTKLQLSHSCTKKERDIIKTIFLKEKEMNAKIDREKYNLDLHQNLYKYPNYNTQLTSNQMYQATTLGISYSEYYDKYIKVMIPIYKNNINKNNKLLILL